MSRELDAARVAALVAVAPAALGGVCLRSGVHPARDRWLALLRAILPPETPLRRIPCTITDDRLLGGLDVAATLRAGRLIAERGVLAASDGGVVLISMAERLSAHTVGCLNAVLDREGIELSRDGVELHYPARIGVIALDEGASDEEGLAASLLDRLAFVVDLEGLGAHAELLPEYTPDEVLAARRLWPDVRVDDSIVRALCATALRLGAGSPRLSVLALRAARAAAALEGRAVVTAADARCAAELVLAPRASRAPGAERAQAPSPPPSEPVPPPDAAQPPESPPPEPTAAPESTSAPESAAPPESASVPESSSPSAAPSPPSGEPLEDMVLAAAQAAIPAGLLASLASAALTPRGPAAAGRSGGASSSGLKGRPAGVRAGLPGGGARLNVVETLRAAAPWQRLRGRAGADDARVRIALEDLRTTRFRQRRRSVSVFVVDASGSSALNRLAESKGAVELLLADCYLRRDQVAVIGFRGRSAELLLPSTRSLVRAKRALAALPGGGGTPLATALRRAAELGLQILRRGETPTVVLLTDGRANVALDGSPGRERAHADALAAARLIARARIRGLFIDTSPRPNPLAAEIAAALRGTYVPLPYASAQAVSDLVKERSRG